jgi:hypothetical protein
MVQGLPSGRIPDEQFRDALVLVLTQLENMEEAYYTIQIVGREIDPRNQEQINRFMQAADAIMLAAERRLDTIRRRVRAELDRAQPIRGSPGSKVPDRLMNYAEGYNPDLSLVSRGPLFPITSADEERNSNSKELTPQRPPPPRSDTPPAQSDEKVPDDSDWDMRGGRKTIRRKTTKRIRKNLRKTKRKNARRSRVRSNV